MPRSKPPYPPEFRPPRYWTSRSVRAPLDPPPRSRCASPTQAYRTPIIAGHHQQRVRQRPRPHRPSANQKDKPLGGSRRSCSSGRGPRSRPLAYSSPISGRPRGTLSCYRSGLSSRRSPEGRPLRAPASDSALPRPIFSRSLTPKGRSASFPKRLKQPSNSLLSLIHISEPTRPY